MIDLKQYIRDIPDFPSPGILFKDITPLLQSPKAFNAVIATMSNNISKLKPTALLAIESRGFLFACPVAHTLSLPFVPIRKPGKLPYKSVNVEYSLEYGSGKLEMHQDAINQNDQVVIIDDLLATGGTALGAKLLCDKVGAKVLGYQFAIELSFLNGRKNLEGFEVNSLCVY